MEVLGIAGSLRSGSYNRMLLKATIKLAPSDINIREFDLSGIPPFNQDQELEPPNTVAEFKKMIKKADAIIIVTPEYNYSIPGVLKNAIDWASRPYGDNSFDGKPVAILGATIGGTGTIRAQFDLRKCFVFLNMFPLNQPEIYVSNASDKFNEKGELTDEKTKLKIKDMFEALSNLTKKIQN